MTNPTSIICASAYIQIHGGFGFTEEYDIERKFRETWLYSVEAISAPT
jgi:alkylation response protein AidB-like acyl-CoA dehydrogenase